MRMALATLALLTGCVGTEPDVPPDAPPPLTGAALVEARCGSGCHGLDWVARHRADEAGWSNTIDRMIAYGATVLADERPDLVAYLAATYPP